MPKWLLKLLGFIIQGKIEGKWSEGKGPSGGGSKGLPGSVGKPRGL